METTHQEASTRKSHFSVKWPKYKLHARLNLALRGCDHKGKHVTKIALTGSVLVASLFAATSASAANPHGDAAFSIAVFGDWPYAYVDTNQSPFVIHTYLLDNASKLIDSVNGDHDVSLVMHVGDIHSGKEPCTSAGLYATSTAPLDVTDIYAENGLQPIPNAKPDYDQKVYALFQQFKAPLVYTPGDNEWTDCHKSKELSSGAPLKELASVRRLFFARPGHTLGLTDKTVLSQAQHHDPQHPEDAKFVENVMWETGGVVFATMNVPGGSNNDDVNQAEWSPPFTDDAAQLTEATQRTAADIRWLDAAFDKASAPNVRAVVIGIQADLWDPEKTASELTNYQSFVQELADRSVEFGRPVLLINGDSHKYIDGDHPLADPYSAQGQIYDTEAVANLTRIVVQGSTNAPAEWLKLTVNPGRGYPFSWHNVPYCNNPKSSTCE